MKRKIYNTLEIGDIYLWKSFPTLLSQTIILHRILCIEDSFVTLDMYSLVRRKNNHDIDIRSYQYHEELNSAYVSEFIKKEGVKVTDDEWNKFKNILNSFSKFFIKLPEVRRNEELVKDPGIYARASSSRPEIKSFVKITKNKGLLRLKELSISRDSEEIYGCNIKYKSYSANSIKVIDSYRLTKRDWYKRVRCYNRNILRCNSLFKYYGFKSR